MPYIDINISTAFRLTHSGVGGEDRGPVLSFAQVHQTQTYSKCSCMWELEAGKVNQVAGLVTAA